MHGKKAVIGHGVNVRHQRPSFETENVCRSSICRNYAILMSIEYVESSELFSSEHINLSSLFLPVFFNDVRL